MEFDENEQPAEQQDYDIEIYSKRAIFWFTVILSPIFGGVMLMYNLRTSGYKREALTVLLFSVAYYLVESYAFAFVKLPMIVTSVTSIALNIVAAFILTRYFFKKYFPEEDYYPKSISTPLIIAVVLIVINIILVKQYMPQLMPK